MNTFINDSPFKLHAPGYNFLGPGIKLNKRLACGDVGINSLDKAAKPHNMWYRGHPKTEDRWISNNILQKKAWDGVISSDAELIKRAVEFVISGGLWLKRKLGIGIV